MTYFHVNRVQYPIGQGGFHATSLHHSGRRFSMVVDCGGDTREHRQGLISAFAVGRKEHDILAISHLDWDHIGGIKALTQAGVRFANVFLPHVDEWEYARWMTVRLASIETETDALVAEAVDIMAGLYGGRYGRPVRVVSGDGGDLPQGRPGENDRYPRVSDLLPQDLQVILSSMDAHCRFPAGHSIAFSYLDWILRFYTWEWKFPDAMAGIWESDELQPLSMALRDLVQGGLQDDSDELIDAVTDALRTKVSAAKANRLIKRFGKGQISGRGEVTVKALLGKLYSAVPGLKDYNDASLCVYSGPAQRSLDMPHERFRRYQVIKKRDLSAPAERGNEATRAVGWLHTGDVNLSDAGRATNLVRHYIVELPVTSVLVLPHHGSRHSYSPTLEELDTLIDALAERPLFVATAQPDHKYGHPHAAVAARCLEGGCLHIVDRRPASILQESTYVAGWHCCYE
ncbi:MBL fold metallo-hydrolase [Burkholderia cepacia]|uniref:MBL fold metallo-hydrolase n=1 Tax=Burkholderia cepacia TaxID=292 RepID=UPI002AB62D4B|nr:MBL fold metallo-hydrolase [Burkholderia cepacia]